MSTEYSWSIPSERPGPPSPFFVEHSSGFDRVDCVNPDLLLVTLDVHPFFAMMHSAQRVVNVGNRGLSFHEPILRMVAYYSIDTPLRFQKPSSSDSGSRSSVEVDDTEDYDSEEDLSIDSWLESTKD